MGRMRSIFLQKKIDDNLELPALGHKENVKWGGLFGRAALRAAIPEGWLSHKPQIREAKMGCQGLWGNVEETSWKAGWKVRLLTE